MVVRRRYYKEVGALVICLFLFGINGKSQSIKDSIPRSSIDSLKQVHRQTLRKNYWGHYRKLQPRSPEYTDVNTLYFQRCDQLFIRMRRLYTI